MWIAIAPEAVRANLMKARRALAGYLGHGGAATMGGVAARPDVDLDRWLAAQHRHLVIDLAATLQLDGAGLGEATIAFRHASLVADLGGVLDAEAGLSAVVRRAPVPTLESTASRYGPDAEPPAAASVGSDPRHASAEVSTSLPEDLEQLVGAAASRSPRARLALRNHPAFALARDLDHALAQDLDRDRALDRMIRLVGELYHALNDVTDADLRSVNLVGVPLGGLRWSPATQWPPRWAEQVRRDSVPVGEGLFEVRGGGGSPPTTV